jgi:hypothetical protein
MYVLTRKEAQQLEQKLRRQIDESPTPKLVLYYPRSGGDTSKAAQAIAAAAGDLTQATMLYLSSLAGDGGSEPVKGDPGWTAYRKWRRSMGETRRLADAPGHQFEFDEANDLPPLIAFALRLGWDALIAAGPGDQLLLLSHDDRLEVYRGFDWRRLRKQLVALGYREGS